MKKQLYSVYDLKSEFYQIPYPFLNDEDAKRGMASVFENPDSMLAKYPADYRLFHIGTLDDNSGVLTAESPIRLICELSSLNFHAKDKRAPLQVMEEKALLERNKSAVQD